MKPANLIAVAALLVVAACGGENKQAGPSGSTEIKGLKTPVAFSSIGDDEERAAALFTEMTSVMFHPRCANCHPRKGGPLQGDDMSPHMPAVIRANGMGAAGMECSTCHGSENVAFATMDGSVPGAEPWLLAPQSMGWIGLSAAELCAQVKNTELNGGRSLEDLVEHNTKDHLVNWAWNPGEGRTPAPGDQETFGALTAAWVEAGAHCPAG
ncbi:MAG: Isoquinoline 1-oxidoreductase subunit [Pseudomonadota bacterium]